MVTHVGSRFTLTVPFAVPFHELWTRDYTVKIILPEHARDVQVNVPFEVQEVRDGTRTQAWTKSMGNA
jgi:hypothetical protein